MLRGSSWYYGAGYARAAWRGAQPPGVASYFDGYGFRLVLAVPSL